MVDPSQNATTQGQPKTFSPTIAYPPVYVDPHGASFYRPPGTQAPSSYYVPDMTTVALQQMHLQTILQMHAQQGTLHPANSSIPTQQVQQPQRMSYQPLQRPTVPDAQMASAYRIGRYTPAERKIRLERYREKRAQRNYKRRVKYDCRKQIADKRRRVQGRFVKREEEIALAANEGHVERSDATDATEEDTKLPQPESSGSASSARHIDLVTATNHRDPDFCDQSDQMLPTFR